MAKSQPQGHAYFHSETEKKKIYDYCKKQGMSFAQFTRLLYLAAIQNGWGLEMIQRKAE